MSVAMFRLLLDTDCAKFLTTCRVQTIVDMPTTILISSKGCTFSFTLKGHADGGQRYLSNGVSIMIFWACYAMI